jgi:cell pole-organizing protein PopZ
MEEILASIRRIISEEGQLQEVDADQSEAAGARWRRTRPQRKLRPWGRKRLKRRANRCPSRKRRPSPNRIRSRNPSRNPSRNRS